jgi:hypothetical protein
MKSTPDLGYTGEYNAGIYTAALTVSVLPKIVQVTDSDGDPYYEDIGSGRAARVRLDGSIHRCDCGSVLAELIVTDAADNQIGAPLLTYQFSSSFQDQIASLKLPPFQGTAPLYLALRLTATGSSVLDGFFRVVPYGQWGWEGVTLCNDATMLAIEGDLFNTAFYPSPTYTDYQRLAKQQVRLRLIEAQIDPDTIWCDGVLGTPDDDTNPRVATSPSGVGAQVIACLVLPATYAAIAQAYASVTGYKDGRLADKAEKYPQDYDTAMRGAIKSLLSINEQGNEVMTRAETRPSRPRRMVL